MKKYQIIYADPPWTYHVWGEKGCGRSASQHYRVMSLDDICNIPVQGLGGDAVLFLWATAPCMQMAFRVIDAWGFKYSTIAFTWVKRNKKSDSWFWGLGHWTRCNAEYLLLATKGNYPRRINKGVHSVLDDRIMKHSQKPETARKRIVELLGDLPRIELFARQKTEGWDAVGNGINGKDIKQELEEMINGKAT